MAASEALGWESTGYFRSGIGGSRGNAGQVCFRDPGTEGASGKFRLGNECETYMELGMSNEFRTTPDATGKPGPDEPYFVGAVRVAMQSGTRRDWEPDTSYPVNPKLQDGNMNQEFVTALRESYVQGVNIFGPGVKAWAGKRFYGREYINQLDYFYVEDDGPGVGIEDIPLGFAKLNIADMRSIPAQPLPGVIQASTTEGDGPAQNNIDVRLKDIKVPGGGNLTAIYMYGSTGQVGSQSGDKEWQALSGNQLTLIHDQPKFLGGDNTFVVQYGMGIYGGDAVGDQSALTQYGDWGTQSIKLTDVDGKTARDKSSTLRLIENLVMNPTKSLSAEATILYQHVDFGGAKQPLDNVATVVPAKTETTAGIRPVYHFDDIHDLAFEYGYTKVQNVFGITDSPHNAPVLQKFTICPQLTAARSYFGRPQVRVFGTYAMWNDDAKGSVGAPVYQNSTSGFSTGAQVETWW